MSMCRRFREGFPNRAMFKLGIDDRSGVLQVEERERNSKFSAEA